MGSAPKREREGYFVGAGLSCAFGLPNTAALLTEISKTAEDTGRGPKESILREAYGAFYPDGKKKHYLPDTVDFFSSLQAYIDIRAPGLPGVRLREARELLRDLKLSITRLLVSRIKEAESAGRLGPSAEYLSKIVTPGTVVITTNWDLVIERYAGLNGIDVRRTGAPSDSHLLLLKLHGSVDWCEWSRTKKTTSPPAEDFAALAEVTNRLRLPDTGASDVVRVRALEHWGRCWQRISGRAEEPFIVTMYRGKGPELASLSQVWQDAYNALSRARQVEIVGYSLPDDDLEIRTLLRAGLTRGQQRVHVTVRNPAPDVHSRIRQQVFPSAQSDYSPV